MKKEFPILEFDHTRKAILEPSELISYQNIPERAVICFFKDVLNKLEKEGHLKEIHDMTSEMGSNPVYELNHNGEKLTVFHPGVGAPLAIGMLEEVIALGSTKFIACGGAGVLDKNLAVGHLIVPTSAIRDEGTSYHYIEPSREISLAQAPIKAIEEVLNGRGVKYIKGKVWTTDGIYRETKDKTLLRKSEGCLAVEMECSAFAAVAAFRNVQFGQILYGGDLVDVDGWDNRDWNTRENIRENLFWLAVESCLKLK